MKISHHVANGLYYSGTYSDWGVCWGVNPTPRTVQNYCVQESMTAQGIPLSITTFVMVDCVSLLPLPPDSQPDPLLKQHPELLLDRGVVAAQINDFLVSVGTGGELAGTALDPNGGQGG
jgi:hypothetical protein